MAMPTRDDAGATSPDWQELFESDPVRLAFDSERHGINGLWPGLRTANTDSGQQRAALEALAKVASLYVRPDDWSFPYGPAITIQDRRTALPTDLAPEEIALLRDCAPFIPHALLRARVYDVLCLLSSGRARLDFAQHHLDAILSEPIDTDNWNSERDSWDRAVLVARRFGAPMRARLVLIERQLRRVVRVANDGYSAISAADLLSKHGLASDRAAVIARRMERIARSETANLDRYRAYELAASQWHARAGDEAASKQAALRELRSLMDEAEALSVNGGNDAARAAHFFELALAKVRRFSRAVRVELGIDSFPAHIARRIRELGAAALGSMHAFTSESVDLSEAAKDARARVSGLDKVEAVTAFAALIPLSNYVKELADAERSLQEHVFQTLFSTVHYSNDGRIVHRTQQGETEYGVDSTVWKQLIFAFELRVRIMTQAVLFPAYVQLTNEHRLTLADFAIICGGSGLVPADRTLQYARALYYGYDFDFSTAAQLLTPQLENLVRHHFANAGIATSYMTEQNTEMELGISALMDRPVAVELFGGDLAFELRALLCGPIGPNLRNGVAHGLLSDAKAAGAESLYLWWFALRLVFVPYWNALHDVEAAEAREPAHPSADDD